MTAPDPFRRLTWCTGEREDTPLTYDFAVDDEQVSVYEYDQMSGKGYTETCTLAEFLAEPPAEVASRIRRKIASELPGSTGAEIHADVVRRLAEPARSERFAARALAQEQERARAERERLAKEEAARGPIERLVRRLTGLFR